MFQHGKSQISSLVVLSWHVIRKRNVSMLMRKVSTYSVNVDALAREKKSVLESLQSKSVTKGKTYHILFTTKETM